MIIIDVIINVFTKIITEQNGIANQKSSKLLLRCQILITNERKARNITILMELTVEILKHKDVFTADELRFSSVRPL